MTMVTLMKKNLIGRDLQVRGSIHYHHGRKHDSVKEDKVLELKSSTPGSSAGREGDTGPGLNI